MVEVRFAVIFEFSGRERYESDVKVVGDIGVGRAWSGGRVFMLFVLFSFS